MLKNITPELAPMLTQVGMCTNKRQVVLSTGRTMYVNCGQCPACLQEKALRRANRIRYQDQANNGLVSWFVTLTYDNKFIPYIRPSDVCLLAAGERQDIPLYRDNEIRWVTKYVDIMVPGKRKAFVKSGKKERKSWTVITPNVQPLERYTKKDFEYYGYEFDFSKYDNFDFPLLQKKIGVDESGSIPDKTSVLYYKDWQNFVKRLRSILIRDFKIDITSDNFKYSCTGEYGSRTHRAHFHALIWTPFMSSTDFTQAVAKAWPFADPDRISDGVERNYNASSYISSYINSHKKCETFFAYSKPFRSKQRFSNAFAMDLDAFSAKVLREKFFGQNLRMLVERTKEGQLTRNIFVYPSYVINYWFPRFKGYSRLDSDEIQRIAAGPDILATKYYAEKLGFFKRYDNVLNPLIKSYSFVDSDEFDDKRYFRSKLVNVGRHQLNEGKKVTYRGMYEFSFKGFVGSEEKYFSAAIDWPAVFSLIRVLKKKRDEYCAAIGYKNDVEYYQLVSEFAYIFSRIWAMRSSHVVVDKHGAVSDNRHYVYFYDNVSEFFDGLIQHEILYNAVCDLTADEISVLPRSPNEFPENISRTMRFSEYYDKYDKSKRVRGRILPRFYYSKRKIV